MGVIKMSEAYIGYFQDLNLHFIATLSLLSGDNDFLKLSILDLFINEILYWELTVS